MIETAHLTIQDRQPADILVEQHYARLHPGLANLDPLVGVSLNPVFYSVFIKEPPLHIAVCCLYNYICKEIRPGYLCSEVELGIRIFIPEYWGKGYGSEVVTALCELAFSSYPAVVAVLAKTPVLNARAIRCYEKCGFVQYSRAILSGYDMVFMMRPRVEVGL